MTQGNCTLCAHSHLHQQLGGSMRVCRKNPPTPVALPTGHGQMNVMSIWPAVDEKMVCDAFKAELPKPFELPQGKVGEWPP